MMRMGGGRNSPLVIGAHRYWRVKSFVGATEMYLYELQLWETSILRADSAGTTIATDMTVSFGAIANILDGTVSSGGADIIPFPTAGQSITWDFGAGVTKAVTGFKYANKGGTPVFTAFALQYSDDNSVWVAGGSVQGLVGSFDTLSAFIPFV